MSGVLLALLAASGDWAPPGGGGTPPGEDASLPAVDDPLVMAMRPDGERLALMQVGPGRTYTTIAAALAAVASIHTGLVTPPTRDQRIDIVIDPGIYPEPTLNGAWGGRNHVAMYAADGERSSVTIQAGPDHAAGWSYYEGIILDPASNPTVHAGAKYGSHHHGSGTSVYARCTINGNPRNPIGTGWPIGMDGYPNGFTVLYDCDLTCDPDDGRTNMHSAGSTTPTRETMVYVNCRFPDGGLEFDPMGSPAAHELWVVDCTAKWAGIGAGSASTFYGSGNTFTGTGTWGSYRKTPDVTSANWPIPYGGISPYTA